MNTFSVIIPVYNESKYIEKLIFQIIRKLNKLGISYELIICENGSQDDTFIKSKRIALKHTQVKVISLPVADYGLAVKKGFLTAKSKYLVLFDLDYWDTAFVVRSLSVMNNYDALVGSKRNVLSKDYRPIVRKISTLIFSLILKGSFGLKISDTHGIKIINRRRFISIIRKCRMTRDMFDTELLIRGEMEGLRIGEVGVKVLEKRKSRSSIIKRALRTIRDLHRLKVFLKKEYGEM